MGGGAKWIPLVQKLLSRAETLQLGWPLDPALTDNQLARLFYPEADTRASRRFQVRYAPIRALSSPARLSINGPTNTVLRPC